MAKATTRKRERLIERIEPGGFYQGVYAGGFTDATTSLHVPGPIVNIDATRNRQVVSISSLPDPIQIPHKKIVFESKDKDGKVRTEIEVDFDRLDEQPLHDGLFQALQTGIIRQVPDEDVEELYPNAWAARKSHLVFSRESSVQPMSELIEAHEASLVEALEKAKESVKVLAAKPNPVPAPSSK